MSIETVKEVNNPAYKTGMGKNGKPWTLAQITTDQNNMASVFMPIAPGDQVEMTWNDQYGNYSARKVNKQDQANIDAMRKLYELNLAIFKAVTGEEYGNKVTVTPTAPVKPTKDVVVEPTPEEEAGEIDLDQIPF